MAVVILFLVWSAIVRIRAKQGVQVVIILAIVTSAIIGIDVVKSYYIGVTTSFQKDLDIPADLSINEFAERWRNLSSTFTWHLGGFLTNSAILLLLFLWTMKANYSNNSDRLFLSLVFVTILPVLFGDYLVQSRLFYNIPLQIPASIIMYKLYTDHKTSFGKPLLLVLILLQFNYALRAMANMYFIPPGG